MRSIVGLFVVASLASCLDGEPYFNDPTGCVSDDECSDALCVVGACVDPNAVNLQTVDLEIRPPESTGYLPQQFFGIEPGGASRLRFDLQPTAHFSGVVTNDAGAAEAATVIAIPQNTIVGRALVQSVLTDANTGAFELTGVSEQQYRFVIAPLDLSVATYTLPQLIAAGPLAINVDVGTVTMPAPDALVLVSGRVVAGAGIGALGIPELEVRVFDGTRRVSSVGVTDRNGEFSVRLSSGERTGTQLDVEVRPNGNNALFPTVRLTGQTFNTDTILDTIELGAAVTSPVPVSGRVLGPDSIAVAQATIFAVATLGPGELEVVSSSDETGRFSFDLPPGDWRFSARAPSSNPDAGLLAEKAESVTGPLTGLRLLLPPRAEASGSVTDANFAVVPDATLRLIRIGPPGGGAAELLSDVSWSFVTTTGPGGGWSAFVDPARYRLTVSPPLGSGLPEYTRLVDVFTDPPAIEIALPASAYLAGEVMANGYSIGEYAQVRVYTPFVVEDGEGISLGNAETNVDGTFGVVLPDLTWTGRPDEPDAGTEPSPEPSPEGNPDSDAGPP